MRDAVVAALLVGCLAMVVYRPFAGVMMWSWISFMNPHRLAWGFVSELPWAMLTVVATLAGCLLNREPKRIATDAVSVLLMLMLCGVTFTSLVAIGPAAVVWDQWDRTMKVIVMLLLTASMLDARLRIHALVWLMVVSVGYFGVRGGIFTLVTGGGFMVLGPPNTIITDRNHLAVALLVVLPLMNYLRLHSAHRVMRIGLAASMLLTLFAAIGTQSRGALVGLVATAALFWLRSRGKLVSGIAIMAAMGLVFLFMPDSWVERMSTMRNYEDDGSAVGRLTIWRAAFLLALSRPFTGGGFRAIYDQDIVDLVTTGVYARATHSIWLEVLADHGFLVFGIWLGIIVAAVIYTIRITRVADPRPELRWAADLARMSQASIVAFCVGGSFLSMSYWDFFWTLCVVIAATHRVVMQSVAVPGRTTAVLAPAPGGGIPAGAWRSGAMRR